MQDVQHQQQLREAGELQELRKTVAKQTENLALLAQFRGTVAKYKDENTMKGTLIVSLSYLAHQLPSVFPHYKTSECFFLLKIMFHVTNPLGIGSVGWQPSFAQKNC